MVAPREVYVWPPLPEGGRFDGDAATVHFGEMKFRAALRCGVPRLAHDHDRKLDNPPIQSGADMHTHPVLQPHSTAGVPNFLPRLRTPANPAIGLYTMGLVGAAGGLTDRLELTTPRSSRGTTPAAAELLATTPRLSARSGGGRTSARGSGPPSEASRGSARRADTVLEGPALAAARV
eukprot:CAMPEP_0203873432 /NCGR_PEP_ID=MMETSP0359-20131031/19747_1 /ASSEMBLY_ACC=CAM_ASM_000338 /TAXON_ID=268821 /ORGANISM="Scrippsiella Hangoei, Strain SHTV-5" /LENGTH=177 /DNA_ID=CAMNT_0050792129 /DNA_START=96 /DNA_END=626 /DNA_ORIENTATION=+